MHILMNNITARHAVQVLFDALNSAETMTAQDKAAYAASHNLRELARLAGNVGAIPPIGNSTIVNMDFYWGECARLLGLNTELLKRQRFHTRQAAARKEAGIAERKPKNQVVKAATFLFCPLQLTEAFAPSSKLSQVRNDYWLQKTIRQESWIAAQDLVADYNGDKQQYLMSVLGKCNSASTSRALDACEATLDGEILTNGGFGLRKQFWKFVNYHLDSIVPRDLEFIIDIYKAIDREAHNTDRVAA